MCSVRYPLLIVSLLTTAVGLAHAGGDQVLDPKPLALDPSEGQIFEALIKLEQPKKSADRSEGGADHVPFSLWIPPDVKTIRGVFFNPFYLKTSGQAHARAMARHYGFAVIGANYMRVNNKEFAPTLLAAFKDFAAQSKHPELEQAPLLMVGMSAGAGMCVQFTEQLPERVIAVAPVCLEVGPISDKSKDVPMLTIFGEKDGGQMKLLLEKLPKQRQAFDAAWAIAPQWGRRHEFGAANNLEYPFYARVMAQRYPSEVMPSGTATQLKQCDPALAWYADPARWTERPCPIYAAKDYPGDKAAACWFPDEHVARTWQAFVFPKPRLKITSPAGLGDGQAFAVHSSSEPLTVEAAVAEGDTPVTKLILRDGEKFLSESNVTGGKAQFKLDKLPPGIHPLIVSEPSTAEIYEISRPVTIIVK